MKTVWIVNQYATAPSRGAMCRHFMLARELVKHDYEVNIIAGSGHYFHYEKPLKTDANKLETIEGVGFAWIKTPDYTQTQNLKRGIGWISFLISLIFLRLSGRNKPDIIIHSSPSLVPFIGSYILSRRFKAKIIFEFRDVWPMTLSELGNYSFFHPVVFVQTWIEKFALRRSHACISSLEFGFKRLEELGIATENFYWLPNGVAYEEFESSDLVEIVEKNRAGKFTFGYVGSHGKANALDTIVDAASYLKDTQIHISMIGTGSERGRLQEKASQLSLNNITFSDNVPKEKVPSTLISMDGLLISWHDLEIYKYGTSANKLTEYFASGKPIVQAYSGAGDLVAKFNTGITVPADNPRAMADVMRKIAIADKHKLKSYSMNAKKAARENFTFKVLTNKLIKLFNKL
jgi:glycosyltransferase involved in cell wall biosynthesis